MAKVSFNKMDYTQFVEYLKSRGIKWTESKDVDIEELMCEYITVSPVNTNHRDRYFYSDGGEQLK